MDSPTAHDRTDDWVRFAPGKAVLKGVNWGGLKTLYIKEVRRFFKVQMQTVWAPAITTLLYLAIFTVALGRGGRTVLGVPFANFIGPGLIVMAMIQNAFANSSFSLLVGKIQGNIVDYLMPPLSTGELIAGLVGAAVTRAFLVGFAVWLAMLLWPGVSVHVRRLEDQELGDGDTGAGRTPAVRAPFPIARGIHVEAAAGVEAEAGVIGSAVLRVSGANGADHGCAVEIHIYRGQVEGEELPVRAL